MTDLSQRFLFDPVARLILVKVGKVEIGQHVHSAFQTIVSNALQIDKARVSLCEVSTQLSPNDGLTAGSLSIQVTGASLRSEALMLREILVKEAAQHLEAKIHEITLNSETLELHGLAKRCSLFDLPTTKNAMAATRSHDVNNDPTIAASIHGARIYIQDMTLPGMLHARALRGREFSVESTDNLRIITNKGFTALLAESPAVLDSVWKRVGNKLPTRDSSCDGPVAEWIYKREVTTSRAGNTEAIEQSISQSATRPFLLHASIAPSCAIARYKDGLLEIWTHSQGIFPLRDTIAHQLEMDTESVIIRHVPSAGSYGHNAADDAAMDAALVSLQTKGAAVRVAWTRQDEFQFSPVGAPMTVQIEAQLADDNSIANWRQTIWSGPHGQRPGSSGNVNLLASKEQDPAIQTKKVSDLPDNIGGGAARNAYPPYSVASFGVTTHLVQDLPVCTSSIRGLGAQINVVCIESMIDKLADSCATNPLEFRIENIKDLRGRNVLQRLKSNLDTSSIVLADNEAIGISYSRYKSKAAYAAVATKLRLTERIELLDVWVVVDAGCIIDESGALNQIEGGFIQAASWTICEGALLRGGYIDAAGWDDYPILGWSEIPTIKTTLMNANSPLPSLGIGECMVGPASAAIVNGVRKIAGHTLADLPLTRDKFIAEAAKAP